jgi:hypothetical protein
MRASRSTASIGAISSSSSSKSNPAMSRVRQLMSATVAPSVNEEGAMDLYAILRRNGWASAGDLEEAAGRSAIEGDKSESGVRWIRSYVLAEEAGGLGTVCIYEADSAEAIRAHADAADLPVDEIVPVADTVIVRPDPAPVGA